MTKRNMTKAEAKKQATLKKTLIRVYNEKYFPRHKGARGTAPDAMFADPELCKEFLDMLPMRYRQRDVVAMQNLLTLARRAGHLKAREAKPSKTWLKKHFSEEAQKVIEHALGLSCGEQISKVDLAAALTHTDE